MGKRTMMKYVYATLIFAYVGITMLGVNNAQASIKPDGYSIETIKTPENVRFHITGVDVNKNGDLYVATRLGEVWRRQGETWNRFATGLHEPAGLLIEYAQGDAIDNNYSILVAHKPALTRLVDTDNDGKADEYINIASEWEFHNDYHEFNFGPVKDKQGYLHGTLNLGFQGGSGGYRGFAYKVSPKGEFTPYSWGLRSPAGIGISPIGDIFYTDNQGGWVGTSKLHHLKEGKFYGHPSSLRDLSNHSNNWRDKYSVEDLDAMREKPSVHLPHNHIAKSPGNPEWDLTKGKFGPFAGQMFIPDLTTSSLSRVMLEKVKGEYQGAVIRFMDGFQSGNIRAKFDNDGALWIGQTARGWGAEGPEPFGLQKVVWDGTLPFELVNITLSKEGFRLTFTEALDKASVNIGNLAVQQWHYLYHQKYGSDRIDLASVPVKRVKLSADRKVIDIQLPLEAGKVIEVDFRGLISDSGRKAANHKVFYTLNQTH